jgi:hypothetical protein
LLNEERNDVGEMFVAVFFAALEATSAMSLLTPAIEIVSSGDDLCTCCLIASARQRCPPIFDFDVANLVAHATAGVLSQNIPTWECVRFVGRFAQGPSMPATPLPFRGPISILILVCFVMRPIPSECRGATVVSIPLVGLFYCR